MSASNRALTALLLAIVALPACTKSANTGAAATSPDSTDKAVDDPLAELDRLEQQMLQLDLPIARRDAPTPAGDGAGADLDGEANFAEDGAEEELADEAAMPMAAEEPAQRRTRANQCRNICDLSEAICDLELKICSLSESHGGDPTYANACRRASDDCEVAGLECDHCAD